MTEFKIQLEDTLVQSLGYKTIEQHIQEYLNQIILKISAQDVLNDLGKISLENDEQWTIAREQAWKEQGGKYQRPLTA